MRSHLRIATIVFTISGLLSPRFALAGVAMLQHGLETVAAAPLEFAVSPYVAGDSLANNMESQHYSTRGKVFMAAPGFIWLWMSQLGMAGARAMAGVLEVPVGLALLPFSGGPKAILDLENEPALVEEPIRFGTYFTTAADDAIAAAE
jgi:hypothetical protein